MYYEVITMYKIVCGHYSVIKIPSVSLVKQTWQGPCREALRRHLHSLCPTRLHFQYTLDAHLHPSRRPTARLVCLTQLHTCGPPAQSLCMYTVHKRRKTRFYRDTLWGNWRIAMKCCLRDLTSSFSPAPWSLAGRYTTSWTSSQGLSEFFPKMTRCPSVEGGRATKVSQEDGSILNHTLAELTQGTIEWMDYTIYQTHAKNRLSIRSKHILQ